ncbi:MAG: hypothetical protein Q7U16_13545 [Agitococcus sp.]|nr:hypothetical protein [Agitococcus sp.]
MAHQAPIAATSYAACLIYEVIPEISRRLGVLGPLPLKQGDEILRAKTAYQLRLLTGNCLHNISDFHLPGWDLLTHDPVNGNPVVYAIDRLCPGVLGDKEDILVTRMTEVARYRNVAYNGAWTPAILQYA